MNLTNKTALENFDLSQIQDPEAARRTIIMLLNLIEDLNADDHALREENQRLRDAIARLQGVTSKPEIKANQTIDNKPTHSKHSSEQERHQPKPRTKSRKLGVIKIDREEVRRIPPEQLPADAAIFSPNLFDSLNYPTTDEPQPKKINTEKTEQTERALPEKFSLTL